MVQPFWETVWWFLKELNVCLSYSPAIPIPGTNAREMKTYIHVKNYTYMFVATLFIIAATQK